MTQTTLINLHPNEYSQEFHYYPYYVILLMSYLTKYVFQRRFKLKRVQHDYMNESKTLTKHISYECKCKFDGRKLIWINGGTTVNIDASVKNVMYAKNIIFEILLHVVVKIENK